MAEKITLTAADGHELDAWTAAPSGAPKGGVVVIQEIFGVNSHVRHLVDMFASQGYLAVAPALFDRTEKNAELVYDEDGFAKGRELRGSLSDEVIVQDVNAAVAKASEGGKVGLIGYCFGGYVAWLAACEADGLSASVSCYGGGSPVVPRTIRRRCRSRCTSATRIMPFRWATCRPFGTPIRMCRHSSTTIPRMVSAARSATSTTKARKSAATRGRWNCSPNTSGKPTRAIFREDPRPVGRGFFICRNLSECRGDVAAVNREHRTRRLVRQREIDEGRRDVVGGDFLAQQIARHVVGFAEAPRL